MNAGSGSMERGRPSPWVAPGWSWWAVCGAYVVLFVILDQAATAFQIRPDIMFTVFRTPTYFTLPAAISPWHLGVGLHLAMLLWGGWRMTPLVVLAQLLSNYVWATMLPWTTMLQNAVLLTAGYWLLAVVLTRVLQVGLRLQRAREVFTYVGVVVVATALLGLAFVRLQGEYINLPSNLFWTLWRDFWVGHLIGLLTVTPALMCTGLPWLHGMPRWWRRPTRRVVMETAGWLVLTGLVCSSSLVLERGAEFHVLYLGFVPMLWAALRLGVPGAAVAGVLMNSLALITILQHVDLSFPITALQGFMATLGGTGLVVGAVADTQRQSRRDFQSLVEHSLQAVVIIQHGRVAFANSRAGEITGYSPAELRQLSAEQVLALVVPTDRDLVRDRLLALAAGDGTVGQLEFSLLRRDGVPRYLVATGVHAEYDLRPAVQLALLDHTDRHQVTLARQAQEERTNMALAGSQVGLWEWDLRAETLACHRHWAAILGYQDYEVLPAAEMWQKCVHPDDLALSHDLFQRHLAGALPLYETEVRMRAANGDWRWLLFRGRVVTRDAAGRPLHVCGVHVDITDRHLVEAALRDNEAELRAIMAALPDLVLVVTPAGIIETVLAADPAILFRPTEQFLNHQFAQVLPADVVPILERATQAALATGKLQSCEYELPLADGAHWFEGRVLHFAAHGEERLLWVIHDITQRRTTEAELRTLSKRLELALEGAAIGMWDWNLRTNELTFGDRVATMLGYKPAELPPHWDTWESLVHPLDLPQVHSTWDAHVAGQAPMWEVEQRLRRRDHSYSWLLCRGRVIDRTEDGTPLRAIGTFLDINDRMRVAEERQTFAEHARRMEKLKSLGMLAGGVAHDFNNLLMVILGNADLARLDLPATSPVREYLTEITTAGKRAAELSRQMLSYAGRTTMKVEVLQLSELVQDMTDLLSSSLPKKITLRQRLAEYLPDIEADATEVRQILLNLLSNSSEAIGDGEGMVTISTGVMRCDEEYLSQGFLNEQLPAGMYVYLEVTDNGCGMDEETRRQLFDPFFTTKFPGRGLGLASVLGIVRGHRGTIVVQSELGRGSTFSVLFPAVAEVAAPGSATPTEASEWTGQGTILLADDEDGVRTVAKLMIEKLGFTVITANDGREAVTLYSANAKDIVGVLLDVGMPELTGEEAFRAIREINPDARVVLSSGYSDDETANRCTAEGLFGFIQKPYQFSSLKHLLWRLVDGVTEVGG